MVDNRAVNIKKIPLNIGDVAVSDGPSMLETILGSCVAVCLWDGELKIAGMNHYMMPYWMDTMKDPMMCGPESIEALMTMIINRGANIKDLRAKIFGGGRVLETLTKGIEIGKENVRVAREVLEDYGIPVIKEYTGNDFGIKVVFYSDTGRAFIKKLDMKHCTACKENLLLIQGGTL